MSQQYPQQPWPGQAPQPPYGQPPYGYPPPPPKKSMAPLIIGIAVLVIALAVGAFFYLGNQREGDGGQPTTTQPTTDQTSNNGQASPVVEAWIGQLTSFNYMMKTHYWTDSGAEGIQTEWAESNRTANYTEVVTTGKTFSQVTIGDRRYQIYDDEQKIVESDGSLLSEGHQLVDRTYVGSGRGDFRGRDLAYDEYTMPLWDSYKIFYDGNQVIGFRSMWLHQGEEHVTWMEVNELSTTYDAKVFDLPNYPHCQDSLDNC